MLKLLEGLCLGFTNEELLFSNSKLGLLALLVRLLA